LAAWEEKGWAIGFVKCFCGAKNLYKNFDETQQQFLEDLVLYIFKGYRSLSTYENIWLHMLVLQ
jgi:hypothetical protein